MRTFFTTQVPKEIRDKGAARRHPTKQDFVTTQQILNAAGLAVPHWPVEYGGRDWTPLQRHIWREEMQLAHVPEPLAFNTSMIGPVLAQFGNQEQKDRFLAKTANLDIWWCQGFSEPDAGSDLASLRTVAVQDGDEWVVNGQKTWPRPGLLAVDDPVVAVADGGGAQRGEVGAGVGLGEALAPPDVEVRRLRRGSGPSAPGCRSARGPGRSCWC